MTDTGKHRPETLSEADTEMLPEVDAEFLAPDRTPEETVQQYTDLVHAVAAEAVTKAEEAPALATEAARREGRKWYLLSLLFTACISIGVSLALSQFLQQRALSEAHQQITAINRSLTAEGKPPVGATDGADAFTQVVVGQVLKRLPPVVVIPAKPPVKPAAPSSPPPKDGKDGVDGKNGSPARTLTLVTPADLVQCRRSGGTDVDPVYTCPADIGGGSIGSGPIENQGPVGRRLPQRPHVGGWSHSPPREPPPVRDTDPPASASPPAP